MKPNQNTVVLFPDYRRADGIWGLDESEHQIFFEECRVKAVQDLADLELWLQVWRENFHWDPQDRLFQRWRSGFDVVNWIDEGDRIVAGIERKTGYHIERCYRFYRNNPSDAFRKSR